MCQHGSIYAPTIRLFQIMQALRRSRRPVTAEALAAELEVSTRSVYRDIANLMTSVVVAIRECRMTPEHLL